MGLLVVVLLLTNLVSVTALAVVRHRDHVAEEGDATEVFAAPCPPGVSSRNRRLITIEILNPIELATHRGGRVGALASTIAPGFTRRIVYDQTLKTLRRDLNGKAVHADVRVHTLRAIRHDIGPASTESVPDVVDEVATLDLDNSPRA